MGSPHSPDEDSAIEVPPSWISLGVYTRLPIAGGCSGLYTETLLFEMPINKKAKATARPTGRTNRPSSRAGASGPATRASATRAARSPERDGLPPVAKSSMPKAPPARPTSPVVTERPREASASVPGPSTLEPAPWPAHPHAAASRRHIPANEVVGTEESFEKAIERGFLEPPLALSWPKWQNYRKRTQNKPAHRTPAEESALWRRVMLNLFGKNWREETNEVTDALYEEWISGVLTTARVAASADSHALEIDPTTNTEHTAPLGDLPEEEEVDEVLAASNPRDAATEVPSPTETIAADAPVGVPLMGIQRTATPELAARLSFSEDSAMALFTRPTTPFSDVSSTGSISAADISAVAQIYKTDFDPRNQSYKDWEYKISRSCRSLAGRGCPPDKRIHANRIAIAKVVDQYYQHGVNAWDLLCADIESKAFEEENAEGNEESHELYCLMEAP